MTVSKETNSQDKIENTFSNIFSSVQVIDSLIKINTFFFFIAFRGEIIHYQIATLKSSNCIWDMKTL